MIGFLRSCIYIQYFFDVVRNKLPELIKRSSKVEEKNMSCGCALNHKSMSLIMACLQIYRELLSLATFLRVHSNSKEVSYLS